MIAYLEGVPLEFGEDFLVLKVNGVGYEVFTSSYNLESLQDKSLSGSSILERSNWETRGDEGYLVQLFIYTHVREDQITLYGFKKKLEKFLFLSLLKVNGIGPKMALRILSATEVEKISQMIEEGDVKALTKLPKVGKKTAEQIILSLKGKLVLDEGDAFSKKFAAREDIISALVHLGFKLSEVEAAVSKMEPSTGLQAGVKQGLGFLTKMD